MRGQIRLSPVTALPTRAQMARAEWSPEEREEAAFQQEAAALDRLVLPDIADDLDRLRRARRA